MPVISESALSNYNIFGYDPEGRLAHVVAHFFGPAWTPGSFTHLPNFDDEDLAPPRYGFPAPQQMPYLPANFTPHLAPFYSGAPSPPYLPGPAEFDPKVFDALLYHQPVYAQETGPLLRGLPIGEVSQNVWNIPVRYIADSMMRRFGILSNISWDDFRLEACMHLGVDRCDSEVHLAYYMIGQEFYSGLTGIRDSKDWASAMTIFCDKARDNEELDFEILDVSGNARIKQEPKGRLQVNGNSFREHALHVLGSYHFEPETYAFEYPKLETLLDALSPELLDAEEREVLRTAGVEYADDFTLISPLNLCLSTEIGPERIRFLYTWIEQVIGQVHEENQEFIDEIEELRLDCWLMDAEGMARSS